GLRQGATGSRSVPGAAGPPPSVGGGRTARPSSAGFARAADPGGGSEGAGEAPFDEVGGLRRGATRLRSANRISFHRARHSGRLPLRSHRAASLAPGLLVNA